jgi:phosphoribosyl-AMP cyclohydrolase
LSSPCSTAYGKNRVQHKIASDLALRYASHMTDIRESGLLLDPKYDANGLLTAVVVDAADGAVLMVGHMNQAALEATRESGKVTFFSRSRQRLWTKGESSGHFLHLVELRIDCDQDALLVIARPDGPTCHTGERSCFYRRLSDDGLERL